jgi:hypothetical protein
LTRRLLPLVIALPVVLGFIRVVGQNAGLYDTAMGTAMLVLVLIALLCAVLWWGAGAVREYESKLVTSIRELEGVFRAAPAGIAVSRDSRCERVEVNAAFAGIVGIREGAPALAAWAETARTKPKPTKSEQDQLDACICLVSALHLAKRRDALFVGCCTTGYIVVPYSEMLRNELEHRCWELGRESARWVRVLQWGAAASTVVPDI